VRQPHTGGLGVSPRVFPLLEVGWGGGSLSDTGPCFGGSSSATSAERCYVLVNTLRPVRVA